MSSFELPAADEAPARWSLRAANHSGEVKRWTNVIEQRSSNLGEIVGSWVAMMTLTPLCRCSRIAVRRLLVNTSEAELWCMNYLCQSVTSSQLSNFNPLCAPHREQLLGRLLFDPRERELCKYRTGRMRLPDQRKDRKSRQLLGSLVRP